MLLRKYSKSVLVGIENIHDLAIIA